METAGAGVKLAMLMQFRAEQAERLVVHEKCKNDNTSFEQGVAAFFVPFVFFAVRAAARSSSNCARWWRRRHGQCLCVSMSL